jgi:heme A synthase
MFISMQNLLFARLVLITIALTLCANLLGTYTHITLAGLAHPEWMESLHRYTATSVGLLLLILTTFAFLWKKRLGLKIFFICTVLILITIAQIFLGKMTRLDEPSPIVLLGHLSLGLTTLSLLWLSYCMTRPAFYTNSQTPDYHLRLWSWIAFTLLALQILLDNGINTPLTVFMQSHMAELSITLYLGLLSLVLIRHRSYCMIGISLLLLFILQMSLSMIHLAVFTPAITALLHHFTSVLMLLTLITLLFQLHHKPQGILYG